MSIHKIKSYLFKASAWITILALVCPRFGGFAPVPAQAQIGPVVGSGFTVTAADLAYILKQIKIAEYHVANTTSATGLCGALVGPGPNQIPSVLLSFGLRTVDGSCNNLQPGQEKHGAADQAFPRLTVPNFNRPAENGSNYNQTSGTVTDSQPRVISNLIVDQTSANPSAVFVAGFPPRTQGNPGVFPCTIDPDPLADPPVQGVPAGCVPSFQTLFIPNVTTDVGLSPPFNSLFTIFGQFFDHGLDKITNGGAGSVFVPLKSDDPLICGNDHICGNGDDIPSNLRFMAITRGTILNGPDGFRSAPNTDTPFVDQSQTYTSHSSHQVFTREYQSVAGKPVATGKFASESDGGIATWATIKDQAATKLGLLLVDVDVNNIPMIAADLYGNFIPGPARGLPQYVTDTGLVEGCIDASCGGPVPAPANVKRIDTAFLNDIAHSAGPGSITSPKIPDSNGSAGGSLDPVASGEYDDELLDLHYICGDGRCNENIALTAVHEVFHLEHDRLANEFDTITLPANPSLSADYHNTNCAVGCATNNPLLPTTFTYGERLFQAARFVTEMQYQHLVFEEFARKVQPAINPFEPFAFNQTDVNPAITAEFAHAVYRFGHSMLTDTIPFIGGSIELFDAFLNPAAFRNLGSASDATGSLIMGLSDQVGQEIDEFVTEAVRNRLLGLPQDLPAINMTRARSEGIPPLNSVRAQIFARTNDGQLAPYTNWVDFGANLKHPSSLVNFVAAYGTHPTILAATTVASKRAAARAIVDPRIGDITPDDAGDFMFTTGTWLGRNTGVDDIDLWVGGLAEQTNLFGGLLGPTFNYVFENQLTNLQNGDRFYYLARTPGMNLRTQLEGNSFAELVMRNTPNTHTLKADPFATADCKFELSRLTFGPNGLVNDDPLSDCDESALLIRQSDGSIRYRTSNTIDPPGINGQGVYNGSTGIDGVWGGVDNDTFWGGTGNDKIEGLGGDDVALGGLGDDIITDASGFDVMKGGPGNDAMDGGPNDDLLLGGDGKDFTNGGANINETFGGPGDDFAIAGQGADAVFGDSGDDWEEGGDQPDLLIGDSSTLFFDDHNVPGHDILIGQGGDDDYDMEGGDDIGVDGPGVEKVAGASGWDWEISVGNPQPMNADLNLAIVNAPPANETRDRFNEVEALSGWKFDDILRGDSVVPALVGGLGFIGCDALDQAGLDRIAGLDALVPPLDAANATPLATVIANSVTNYCLLASPFVWGQGNILLGGDGSDTFEGRGANDIIDGDKYLNVRLSVRQGIDTNGEATGPEIGSTDLMENAAVTGNFGPGTSGMTLQAAVFARLVNPGQIVAVREILLPSPLPAADCGTAAPKNCDTALFSGPQNEYTITLNSDGSVTVADNADPAAAAPITPAVPRSTDGIDTLWNIEQLSFCTTPGAVRGTCTTRATGVSIAPAATVAPTTLSFGSVTTGTTSAAQTITVTNTGLSSVTVSSATSTGGDASLFLVTNNCTAAVPAGGSCTISVRFAPTSTGAKSANVVVTHSAGSASVAVSGTGTAPATTLTPNSLSFGNVLVGNSQRLSTTLTNSGSTTLSITSITVTGTDFVRPPGGANNNCGTSLAAGASCGISVRFSPTTGGSKSGSLQVVTATSTQTVPLTGTGTVRAVADVNTVAAASSPNPQVIAFDVLANDTPTVGTVTIDPSSINITNGGGGATVAVVNNQVTWTLTTTAGGGNARRAQRRGTYRVRYRLTNGTATDPAIYTLTIN